MILIGDVRQKLKELPDQSVHCCVTSPPYWGLRDYGTASWDGGDSNCDHQGKPVATKANINRNCGTGNDVKNAEAREFFKEICGKCGAKRIDSQIGLEQTPEEYVAQMVQVFREVWRVLRDDGTLWLNLGDSYVADSYVRDKSSQAFQSGKETSSEGWLAYDRVASEKKRKNLGWAFDSGLKKKDLVAIPWRVAFALQAEGWYLRQDIIWHKPNPMPESVTDRCTKAHEYIFLLSKSAKYYFDHEAIKEPSTSFNANARSESDKIKNINGSMSERGVTRTTEGLNLKTQAEKTKETRNRRSVWTVSTRPFKGAHFATFPPQLIEPCILAGCPLDGTILDPFFGAGTTGLVAQQHGRKWIGCELNPVYAEMAAKRIKDAEPQPKLFT